MPEKYEEYKTPHAAVWRGVLEMIHKWGIRNYAIYHKEGLLFSHFEFSATTATPIWKKCRLIR